jgi:hypothetical protein
MKSITYLGILFSFIFATCNKKIDCSQTTYSFEGFYNAYPQLDSIRVGDTIWIESGIETHLTDILSSQIVDFSGAENLGMAAGYFKLIGGDATNPGVLPSAGSFINVLKKGSEIPVDNPVQNRGFLYVQVNNEYQFLLGVVAKDTGIFAISFGNATNVYTSKNNCEKADFSLTFKNTEQHLYFYQNNRPGYQLSQGEKSHAYCFKVY